MEQCVPVTGEKDLDTKKYSVGKNVRITMKKTFDKNTIKDDFKIFKIQLTIPLTTKITDYNGEEIQGSFYEQELQKTKQDIFRIEKILKQ